MANTDHDPDLVLVRNYTRALKIACDELHDDPFDPVARAQLRQLIQEASPTADAAHQRLLLRIA
ncbi:hypothetical protein H7I87_08175 [Mycobacterium timonense]|uniref:Uncharacterized protein n=2 Tax=Mycobacterium TaxID=1763 RepID=A0AAW5SDC2_MYCBC|nr:MULTISPECIES: hypothetical protein [Mycobacterium]ETB45805.1 hypothetical protein O981_28930 [Mycobacterium avium 10-5560]MCV6993045.1 hypothetical protein [Mycobacterium bouchedurhonense]MCV6994704.1 hypothetical protein [Mycobacterium timonense]ORA44978.1 hypothetical protein BST19_20835 [Mycobacterium bouchedurhonense]CQD23333.1 hypothetical protein BN000_05820 [Mycobacterium europaeum]